MNATTDQVVAVIETVLPTTAAKKAAAPRKTAAKKTASTATPAKKAAAPRKTAAKMAVTATVAAAEAPAAPTPITITVSLLVLGQSETTMELSPGSTSVFDLMVTAHLTEKAGEVLVNSQRVETTHVLKDGDKVVFASKIKGG